MPRLNTYRDGFVHVRSEMCPSCIFRPHNLMHLNPGCVKELVTQAIATDGHIPCHETLHTTPKANAVCRGFYDQYGNLTVTLKIAAAMRIIKEDS